RQARRAAPRPRRIGVAAAEPPPPAEVVAGLRRAPASPPPTPPAPRPAPRYTPPPLRLLSLDDDGEDFDDLDDVDDDDWDDVDEARRPVSIAHGPAAASLVEVACEEEWMVRLSFRNGNDQSVEQTVAVMEIDRGMALVERLPGWEAQTLVLSRVEWARVLTKAEEDVMLYG
ncbi:MAG: hypothetical protein ACRD1K_18525, partial [Acidimicrobiales bacterium]